MSGFDDGVDPALRAEFMDEALDGLEQVTGLFVQLESNPDDPVAIQAIFRPIHSIKGNAVYFGLLQLKALAHEMETLLDLLRKGALPLSGSVTDVLLRGADELRGMLLRARDGLCEVADPEGFAELVLAVRNAAGSARASEEAMWRALLAAIGEGGNPDITGPARELAGLTEPGRRALGGKAGGTEEARTREAHPAAHLRSAVTSADPMPDGATVRELLEECRAIAATMDAASIAANAVSGLTVLEDTIGLDDPLSRESILDALDGMAAAGAWETKAGPAADPGGASGASAGAEVAARRPDERRKSVEKQDGAGKTMRIPEKSIDAFLAHVGELIMIGEMYSHLQTTLADGRDCRRAATDMRRANEAFNDLAHALQNSIMQIRKVPVNLILQRAPRIVRDIATAKGKEIETALAGGDLMIDKSLLDVLEAPLTHMIRNSADHGIESPADRQAAGKPAKGSIHISVEETAESIRLCVRDDGRGLDRAALSARAVELGLIPADASLTDEDVVGLLFASGVSTAREVTDVSGRGVGMDVVRCAIEGMGGRIAVSSEPGRFTEFAVQLPKTVTTEIIDGYVVIVGGKRYVFPLKQVLRCFRPGASDIISVQGRGKCVRDGGQLLPVSRLSDRFGARREDHPGLALHEGILVVVETRDRPIAVHVDEIEGVRRVVLKDIDGLDGGGSGLFLGGAVIGDGSVAMVVDVEQIARADGARAASPGQEPALS